MKKNIQAEIIKSLGEINRSILKLYKSQLLKKPILGKGFLEWSNEEKNFFKINQERKLITNDLLYLDKHKNILIRNTTQFLKNQPANSALLWGARGTGKSSLIISVCNELKLNYSFLVVEIKFFQINFLPLILRRLEKEKEKIIIFCDDFSFEFNDEKFILFKNIIEGSLRNNTNIIFYVTSNFRHLVRDNVNSKNNVSNLKDINENITSLSDRFGIWLGFHSFNQKQYNEIVSFYANIFKLKIEDARLQKKADEWAILRGSNSGREALNLVKYLMLYE